jgi:predicted Zn-dependent protease
VRYLRSAGYRPEAMAAFLEKLRELDRKRPRRAMGRGTTHPYYALSHPYVSDRLRVVKQAVSGHIDFTDYINKTE